MPGTETHVVLPVNKKPMSHAPQAWSEAVEQVTEAQLLIAVQAEHALPFA